jgi:hypothetical protein
MIRTIKTNIKSGSDELIVVGPKTLLHGPNESGKSTVVEAIQLALTGGVYGVLFKDKTVKSGAQLCGLGSGDLYAEVETDSGSIARWDLSPGKKPKQSGEIGQVFPVAELHDVLRGSPATARKFFFRIFGEAISGDTLEASFPKSSYDLSIPLGELLPDLGPTLYSPDDILRALAKAGSEKRAAKSECTVAKKMLSTFSRAEKIDPKRLTESWGELVDGVRFEWAKKLFKAGLIDKKTAQEVSKTLGAPKDLVNLRSSAIMSEEIEQFLELNALYQSLLVVNDVAEVCEERSKSFEELETVFNDLIYNQIKKPIQQYAKRVNKFLPKEDVFSIKYDKTAFSIGLERDGVVHYALSGSTEARVLAAMAAGLAGTEPSIIVVDDRMWDTQTLAEMMGLLEQTSSQVFVMSTLKPRGRQRSAWTYIEMVGDENGRNGEGNIEETPVLSETTEVAEDAAGVAEEGQGETGNDEEDILDVLFG